MNKTTFLPSIKQSSNQSCLPICIRYILDTIWFGMLQSLSLVVLLLQYYYEIDVVVIVTLYQSSDIVYNFNTLYFITLNHRLVCYTMFYYAILYYTVSLEFSIVTSFFVSIVLSIHIVLYSILFYDLILYTARLDVYIYIYIIFTTLHLNFMHNIASYHIISYQLYDVGLH